MSFISTGVLSLVDLRNVVQTVAWGPFPWEDVGLGDFRLLHAERLLPGFGPLRGSLCKKQWGARTWEPTTLVGAAAS